MLHRGAGVDVEKGADLGSGVVYAGLHTIGCIVWYVTVVGTSF